MIKFTTEIEQMPDGKMRLEIIPYHTSRITIHEVMAADGIHIGLKNIVKGLGEAVGKMGAHVIFAEGESAQKVKDSIYKKEGHSENRQDQASTD